MILRKAINHTKLSDKIAQITVQYCLINDGGPYHIETSPLICRANQWTDF